MTVNFMIWARIDVERNVPNCGLSRIAQDEGDCGKVVHAALAHVSDKGHGPARELDLQFPRGSQMPRLKHRSVKVPSLAQNASWTKNVRGWDL